MLGALNTTVASFTTVAEMIYREIVEQGKVNHERHGTTNENIAKIRLEQKKRLDAVIQLVGTMRLELATLTDQLSTVASSHNIQLGAIGTARDAIVRSNDDLKHAVENISSEFATHRPEDEEGGAPRPVRVLVVRITNFVWPHAVRSGRAAALWGVKLVAGSAALTGLAKIIHDLIAATQ